MNREKEVARFIFRKMSRNLEILVPLIEEAQEDGDFEVIPVRQAVAFIMAAVNMPTLASETMDRALMNSKKGTKLAKILETQMTTDAAITQRIDLAIKALSKHRKRGL